MNKEEFIRICGSGKIENRDYIDSNGNTLLMYLCKFYNGENLNELIYELKDQIKKINNNGDTALIILCKYCKNISPNTIEILHDEIGIMNNEKKFAVEYYFENNYDFINPYIFTMFREEINYISSLNLNSSIEIEYINSINYIYNYDDKFDAEDFYKAVICFE